MDNMEIMLNLWYVCDEWGFIYSLRARTYIGTGTYEEKLKLLQRFAGVDYLIARIFTIPNQYRIDGKPLYHKDALALLSSPAALFEEAIRTMQNDLPVQTHLDIPVKPIICVTPLLGDDNGYIIPKIDEVVYLH